jgi:hypothetical protein
MSTTLRTSKLIDLCTPSISYDRQVQSACESFDHQMWEIADDMNGIAGPVVGDQPEIPPQGIVMIPNIMGITDEKLVDILAWQFHVDFYDEASTRDFEFRKRLVQMSIIWHKTKGTVALVQYVLDTYWPGGATLSEWFEYMTPLPPPAPNPVPGGVPAPWHDRYRFRVYIDETIIDPNDEQQVLKLIDHYKPISRWCEGIFRSYNGECDIGWCGMLLRFIIRTSEAADIEHSRAESYLFNGPETGFTSAASSLFSVGLPVGGLVSDVVTVTPSDGGAGGTFVPPSVTLTALNRVAKFTYVPSSTAGDRTITTTNDGGLTDPPPVVYTVNELHYVRQLSVAPNQVPSAQTDFVVPVNIIDATLKSSANGGHVQSPTAFDIRFYSDLAGSTKLSWEISHYDSATGELRAWVKIPSLSNATQFFMHYGDSTITTDQSDPVGTWSNAYKCAYHFGDGVTLDVKDSKNAFNGVITGTPSATAGKIGGAMKFTGAGQFVLLDNTIGLDPPAGSPYNLSGWVKSSSPDFYMFTHGEYTSYLHYAFLVAGGKLQHVQHQGSDVATAVSPVNDDTWHHASLGWDGYGTSYLYLDGLLEIAFYPTWQGATASAPTTTKINLGEQLFSFDEPRIAFGPLRNADWWLTEYRSQSSGTPTLADRYFTANKTGLGLQGNQWTQIGQSFTSKGGTLYSVKFDLYQIGGAVGNLFAKLYATTGAAGAKVITGPPLAVSDAKDATTVFNGFNEFVFTGANRYAMTPATDYMIVVEFLDATAPIGLNYDPGAGTHNGNMGGAITSGAFNAWGAGYDVLFYLYTRDDFLIVDDEQESLRLYRERLREALERIVDAERADQQPRKTP